MNVREALTLIVTRYNTTAEKPAISHQQAVILAAALADSEPLDPSTNTADAAIVLRAEAHVEHGVPVRQAIARARAEYARAVAPAPQAPECRSRPIADENGQPEPGATCAPSPDPTAPEDDEIERVAALALLYLALDVSARPSGGRPLPTSCPRDNQQQANLAQGGH
jgi:hypothetical protein